jgi:regulatory protein
MKAFRPRRRTAAADPDRSPLDRATDAALRHLDRRMRSRQELTDHLLRAGHDPAHVETVCERLVDRGHLDDRAYAGAFARDRVRLAPRGYARIAQELRQRGVDRSIVDEVLETVEAEFPEAEVAAGLLGRRRRSHGPLQDRETRLKAMRWLSGRGFRHQTVVQVIGDLAEDDEG